LLGSILECHHSRIIGVMTLERGSLLNNRYRIIEILGQGGMAAVYRAIDENLSVEVAVKENLFTTEEYARQFRLEATILAGLRQPNLPRVSDHFVIEPQGQYLVMDFIEGEDLRQRLDRLGPLPEQEVIIIGVAICDAMAYMHSRKPMILHRDIKPGNVRITPSGHIFLVDFGLAKLVEGRETTNTGARAMTPGYSPPEQYGSARTDPRSDVYSLGATLYTALTNVLPEDGLDRAMGRMDLTPINKHNPKVSEHVNLIIEKCLAVVPEERYQSAEELRFALMEARSISRRKLPLELVLQPPPMTIHDRLPRETSVNALKSMMENDADVDGGDHKLTRPLSQEQDYIELSNNRPKSRRKVSTLVSWVLLSIFILIGLGIISTRPDLTNRVFGFIALTNTPTNTPTVLTSTNTKIPILVNFSGTSTLVITQSPTVTRTLLPTITNTPKPISSVTPTLFSTPMGGASQIAFASTRSGSAQIWLMNIDGSGLHRISAIDQGACQPKWSPDGLQIVFISPCKRNMTSYLDANLFIMNADGSGITPFPSVPGGDYDPSWSPDGEKIAFTSLRNGGVPGIFIITRDGNTVHSLVEDETRAISQPAWSPDGKEIAYVNSDNRIWVMDTLGENRHILTIGEGDYQTSGPAWSPDGSVVIFTRAFITAPVGSTQLMAVQYTETGEVPIKVPNSLLVSDATYSFDGYWLLFTSWFSGSHDINAMRVNGGDKYAIEDDPAYDFDPAWRPTPPNPSSAP
jgi:serine/threonine protein kinase